MQYMLFANWFKYSAALTLAAVAITFIPYAPIAVIGGVLLLILLPGAQITRWLGFFSGRWNFEAVTLSVALGLVTSPILIYWGSLLFGFSRGTLLIIFSVYILVMAGRLSRSDAPPPGIPQNPPPDSSRLSWIVAGLLIGFATLGAFLAYFELETTAGFYPVQMEDWQKHYGVAFSLRHTGIPPTSMFFYGMFPDEQLVYYYFLHLNGAALDLLQNGAPFLHNAFVLIIVLAAATFGSVFFLLARCLFNSQKAAVWSLAFATVIGGLDIIPIVHRTIQQYRKHFPDGRMPPAAYLPREHIDNWVSALSLRLNTFYSYYIWVPQHLTGLTILCLGLYLYLNIKARRKLLIMLPLFLFTLLGHSTWIAVIVSGGLFLFALVHIVTTYRKKGFDAARTLFLGYAIVAVAFGLIVLPFILTLVGPNAPKSGIAFEIPKLNSWPILRPFQASFGSAMWARILDLPLHFFVEMGALLAAGLGGIILYWKREKQLAVSNEQLATNSERPNLQISNPKSQTCTERSRSIPNPNPQSPTPKSLLPFFAFLLFIGVVTVSLFASGRGWAELGLIQNNDLGLRALMPGQLVLALFAGYFMVNLRTLTWPRWGMMLLNGLLVLLIGLGMMYSLWEFTSMGLAKYTTEPQLSPNVYRVLQDMPGVTTPQDKPFPVVQHRQHRDASRFQLSLGNRPIGFSTGEAVVFHNDVRDLALALELSEQAFDNGLPVWSYQMFHNLGANYIFVGPAEREAMRHPEKYRQSQYFERVYQQGDFEIYQVHPLPYQTTEHPQATFDNGAIAFEGYFLDVQPHFPGEQTGQIGLVTAWRLTESTDKNYTVFIHFVDAAGNIVAQADHQLWAWAVNREGPTSSWPPNITHLDIIPLPDAALAAGSPLTIRLGLWLPDTGEQFSVETQVLEVDAGNRLVIGALNR